MIQLLDHLRPQIEQLCRRHHVSKLELFGSAVSGEFDSTASDFDFLVEFEPFGQGEYTEHFFGLYEDLENLLGRKVDLVVDRVITNPYFREKLSQNRKLLYAA